MGAEKYAVDDGRELNCIYCHISICVAGVIGGLIFGIIAGLGVSFFGLGKLLG